MFEKKKNNPKILWIIFLDVANVQDIVIGLFLIGLFPQSKPRYYQKECLHPHHPEHMAFKGVSPSYVNSVDPHNIRYHIVFCIMLLNVYLPKA